MMHMRIFPLWTLIALLFTAPNASDYPRIDESVPMGGSLSGFNSYDGYIWASMSTRICSSAGSCAQKNFMNSMVITGVRWGGVSRKFSGIHGQQGEMNYGYYKKYFGSYTVAGTYSILTVELYMYNTGKFWFNAFWIQGAPSPSSNPEVFAYMDFDMDGGVNNIFEHVVKDATVSGNGVDMWHASNNAVKVTYQVSSGQGFPDVYADGIEHNAYARIVKAGPPATQFSAVLWPAQELNAVDIQFEQRSGFPAGYHNTNQDPAPPPPVPGQSLNKTYSATNRPQYGFNGAPNVDGAVWLTMRGGYRNRFGFVGKVFQKSNARSLKISTYVMAGANVPDFNLMVSNNRSVKNALDELTNTTWSEIIRKTNLPNPSSFNLVTWSQVHDFMLNSRRATATNPGTIYTSENRANFKDWFVDVCVMNSTSEASSQSGSIIGAMFDTYLLSDRNGIAREGAVVFDLEIRNKMPNSISDQRRYLNFVYAHELGHAFNIGHRWGSCGSSFNYPNCSNGTLEGYNLGVVSGGLSGYSQMRWDPKSVSWYQNGPESWVKPGRYGSRFLEDGSTSPPTYFKYGQ